VTFSALLDTCVLFPMYLRDSLLRLAVADLYRPLWSPHILLELRQALVREGATSPEQADRIIRLIRTNVPVSEIAGYEPLMPTVTCHETDRHVLAAALKAGTTLLITDNTGDFPPTSTRRHSTARNPGTNCRPVYARAPRYLCRNGYSYADQAGRAVQTGP
jgi:PIN domain